MTGDLLGGNMGYSELPAIGNDVEHYLIRAYVQHGVRLQRACKC